ncbi:hypothetical protein E4T56_gene14474 [Termitomyces sp. T112]|nr:hypothetical protein E4T56_gene14474 [Termitomyces sp. T112]
MPENRTLTRSLFDHFQLQDSGSPSQPSRSPPNQLSKDSNDSSCTLLPAFYDNGKQLASNAAASSTVSLLIPSVPSASNRHSRPTSVPASPISASLSSSSHVICFSFCGEDFTYDLNSLEQDPKPVVELLKATESERGNWMMVGAHYRRIGNTRAAISVIETLISFMTAQGVAEGDLKPAFLLLSGCETDMAKRVKSVRPSDAEGHYQRSQRLLQKVYGTFAESQQSRRVSISRPLHSVQPQQVPHSISINDTIPNEGSPINARLERELRSLRKERDEQSTLLAELRAAKRKLEDDFTYECRSRRRLLRDFDDLQKELGNARKAEDHALSQVKREVDARRKAEEVAWTEKGMRQELQHLFEQYTTTSLGEFINTMKSEE